MHLHTCKVNETAIHVNKTVLSKKVHSFFLPDISCSILVDLEAFSSGFHRQNCFVATEQFRFFPLK